MKRLAYLVPVLALASPAALAQQSSMETGGAVATEAGAGRYVVLFGFDRASLDTEARAVLAEAAEDYRRTGQARVAVSGYADTSGDAAYNQRLSDRRAAAVAEELVRQGVPDSAIQLAALGEEDPAVPTGDGDPEAGNRRVVVEVEQAAAPAVAEPAPAPMPASTAAAETSPWRLNLGGFYGYNMEDSGNDARDSHLAGLNLSADRSLNDYLNLSLEQAGFYNFASENDGFGGRSVLGIDFTFGSEKSIPFIPIAVGYIGANLGGIYGSGIDDSFLAGPEVGLKLGPLDAKLAYDIPFNRSWEQGVVAATVGVGIRF